MLPQKADDWAFYQELTAKKVCMGVHVCMHVHMHVHVCAYVV